LGNYLSEMKIALYGKDQNFIDKLRASGAEVFVYRTDFSGWEDMPEGIELFLSLGGDGTFLKSLSLVRGRDIPVAGINFGRLGFLTTAKIGELPYEECIDKLINKDFKVEKRDLLKVSYDSIDRDLYPYAVNEISVQRHGASMLAIDVMVDGKKLPTYWSDGVLIATPTGSTAYCLSVGGPVVDPRSKVVILAPIAPHNLNMRPLVLPSDAKFDIVVRAREGSFTLNVDNRSAVVASGTHVKVSRGEYGFSYASFSDSNFINALTTKLLWGEDRRNN